MSCFTCVRLKSGLNGHKVLSNQKADSFYIRNKWNSIKVDNAQKHAKRSLVVAANSGFPHGDHSFIFCLQSPAASNGTRRYRMNEIKRNLKRTCQRRQKSQTCLFLLKVFVWSRGRFCPFLCLI